MPLDFQRARSLLYSCDLPKLFIEELGWEPCRQKLTLRVGETDYAFTALAEKRGFIAWLCESPQGGLPDHVTRLKLDRKLSETSFEHLIVFVTGDRSSQSWMWVRREQGKPLAARTHEYHRGQPGDSLLQKLQILYVSLEEEEAGLSTVVVAGRARAAFDIEKVTKKFYKDFDAHRKAFLKFIDGIGEVADCEWYASVMLNRLMFVYFIQRKGFLDADPDYLRNRLHRCKQEKGKDTFYTFYRYFLLRLFHEGFGKHRKDRAPDLEKLLGKIPYLNGGLFDVHELEKPERYGNAIQIPDKAFERIFDYFDQYQWHLDERPLRKDDEINPDVLGYIFEKYINQKQMGAYYTKEDITEYISKNTVLPFLVGDARAKCKVAFVNPNGPTVWDLVRENPDRYIYPAMRHGLTWNYISDHPAKGVPLSKPFDLPPEITAGLDTNKPNLIDRRKAWNKPAPTEFALPTETWREVVARRQRYEDVRRQLAAGEVWDINDFITLNLDLRQFAQDLILNSEGSDLLRAIWHAIEKVTVLDPTCGSGAFLFAALNILEPLYETCLDRMEAFVADDDRMRTKTPEESIRELIASGESLCLEFKATARWNVRERRADKAMEQMIIKTIAAFLNSRGGELLIGVQDDGKICGIEADYQTFSADKQNRDAYMNWLMTQLLGGCGKQHTANLRVRFARLDGHDVCRITVSQASNAVYIKENNQDALYVRGENSTRSLGPKEAVNYDKEHFAQVKLPMPVAEDQKSSHPRKYADFRKVLDTVAAHPNRRYFILKSIILNNLFGVDIMEEAVEICKLRLFLKLAAQVEADTSKSNLGIEPLPDIDFNIRAGNSLVGYATYDQVKEVVTSGFDFDNVMETISIKAADLQQTFDKFRQLQTEGDGSVPAADKKELQKRLKVLEDEFNQHLAGEYGVKVSEKANYAKWLKSHQPFHWFIQFYGILNGGGFDVIIGNPPYVEYSKVRGDYTVQPLYLTLPCGNLYTLILERCYTLARKNAWLSLIVPLSLVCTSRTDEVRELVKNFPAWISNYDMRPSSLFEGVAQRLSILITQKIKNDARHLFVGGYRRWTSEERPNLIPQLTYGQFTAPEGIGPFPKFSLPIEKSIEAKLRGKPLAHFVNETSSSPIFVHRIVRYFAKAMNFIPLFVDARGKRGKSEDYKEFRFVSGERDQITTLLNSTLFYWFWRSHCDGFHCGYKDVYSIPYIPLTTPSSRQELKRLLAKLMRHLQGKSEERTITTKSGQIRYQEFYPAEAKPILDEIDTVLAKHYGFTEEELDFILNYDIKYRMGRDTENEED